MIQDSQVIVTSLHNTETTIARLGQDSTHGNNGTNAAHSAVGGVGGTEIVLHSLNVVLGANKYVTVLHKVVMLVGDGTSLLEPLVAGRRDSTGIIKTRGRLQKAWRP